MQAIQTKKLLRASLTVGLVLIAEGCSSRVPRPVGELASADTAISQAEYSGARNYAPVDLDKADTKLLEAYAEFKEENYRKAGRLANEALVDANLASAKTAAAKTIKATQAMEESVLLLQESLEKNQNR